MGVIVEATLQLVDNISVQRQSQKIDSKNYLDYFVNNIRSNPKAIFHNCDLVPPEYSNCNAVTWFQTDKKITTKTQLIPKDVDYRKERLMMKIIANRPRGKRIRANIADPLLLL
jgi:hypothetical protein